MNIICEWERKENGVNISEFKFILIEVVVVGYEPKKTDPDLYIQFQLQ